MIKDLTVEQKSLLKAMKIGIEFAADVAHACVTIYVWAEDPKNLVVYAHAVPKTRFFKGSAELPVGRDIRAIEEPLVLRALQRNVALRGKRELLLGNFIDMFVYPVQDYRGKCFAAITFDVTTPEECFITAACEFLKNAGSKSLTGPCYERLTTNDGLLLVNRDMSIVSADSTVQQIFKVLGISEVIGRRTTSPGINWPLVGMVFKTGIAAKREIRMQGLVLDLRVLPLGSEHLAKTVIVVLRDITALKALDEELELLKESLETRKVVDRAKGILMKAHGLSEDEAYRRLQQYSMNKRVSIKELAEAVIASASKNHNRKS